MDDRRLVKALRAREPGAPADLYDAYAEGLYAYCWFLLRGRDAAQVALRDALIVAEAHVDRLRDPDRLGPWLYAIARLECHRRLPGRAQAPDLPVASHDQDDVDQRVMAWQAVLGLDVLSREALELRVRHRLPVTDLAAILDLPVRDAQIALDRAHAELAAALTAEILAHQGPYGCEARGRLLRERHDRRGEIDAGLRRALLRHTEQCPVCGAFRPRTISAAKVFGLLPQAEPPEELRVRVMSGFLDPELINYRMFVATRVTDFSSGGFPAQPRDSEPSPEEQGERHQPEAPGAPGAPAERAPHRPVMRFLRRVVPPWRSASAVVQRGDLDASHAGHHTAARRLAVGCVFAALLISAGTAVARALMPPQHRPGTAMTGTSQGEGVPAAVSQPPPNSSPVPRESSARLSPTFPLGALSSSAPPTALPSPPPQGELQAARGGTPGSPGRKGAGTLSASPLFLDLADGSRGTIELRAVGGPVAWSAKPWGGVRPSSKSGRLRPGQKVTLNVQVSRSSRSKGEGGLILNPGRTGIRITWRPVTGPSPSPTPTSPGPTPTRPPESPTSSAGPSSPPPSPPSEPPASRTPAPADPPAEPGGESRTPGTEADAPATTSSGSSSGSSPKA